MRAGPEHVLRSLRAEAVRTSGRGPLWVVLAPAATLLPAAITFVIACAAERFARIPGQIAIQQVATSNAAYWVITITVVLTAVAAAYGHSQEFSRGSAEYVSAALPCRWSLFVGKWLFYGILGAVAAALMVLVVLIALPTISPLVYGQVTVTDSVGIRLLWTVPALAFFAAGLGTGVGALVRTPASAVGLLLFWVYAFEIAVGYLPGGVSAQRFMPFLNAVYATGQDIVLFPPWGPSTALLYVCGVFALVFACGLLRAPTTEGSKR